MGRFFLCSNTERRKPKITAWGITGVATGNGKTTSNIISATQTVTMLTNQLFVFSVAFDNSTATTPTVASVSAPGLGGWTWLTGLGPGEAEADSPTATAGGGVRTAMLVGYATTGSGSGSGNTFNVTLSGGGVTARALSIVRIDGPAVSDVVVAQAPIESSAAGAASYACVDSYTPVNTGDGNFIIAACGTEDNVQPGVGTADFQWGANTTGGGAASNVGVTFGAKIHNIADASDDRFNIGSASDGGRVYAVLREAVASTPIVGSESTAITISDTSSVAITEAKSATDTAAITVTEAITNRTNTTTDTAAITASDYGEAKVTSNTLEVVNGTFETGWGGWYGQVGGGHVLSRSSTNPHSGTWSLAATRPDAASNDVVRTLSNTFPVTVGNIYTAGAWITAFGNAELSLVWLNSGGGVISEDKVGFGFSGGGYVQTSISFPAPATAVRAQIQTHAVSAQVGGVYYVDDVTLAETVIKSATDTAAITIADTSAAAKTDAKSATDTAAITITDAVTAKNPTVADTTAITATESVSQTIAFTTTDTSAISVADVNAGITGQSTPVSASESTAISVAESVATAISVSTTDTAAITIADASAPNKQFSSTDTTAVSVADVSATAVIISATDTAAISVAEVTSGSVSMTSTETTAITIADTSSVNSGTSPAGNESVAISIAETTAIFKTMVATDTTAITITEAAATNLSPTATDTAAVSVADVATVAVLVSTTDTTAITISDVSAPQKNFSATDTTAISVADAVTAKNITTTDTTAITITETTALFVTKSATDGAAVSVADVALVTPTLTITATDTSAISVADVGVKFASQPSITWEEIDVIDATAPQATGTHVTVNVTVTQAPPSAIEVVEIYY